MTSSNLTPLPECPRPDCRFQDMGGMTTTAYYPPIYNKEGKNINPDMNTSIGYLECLTCGRKWSKKSQGNTHSNYEEMK